MGRLSNERGPAATAVECELQWGAIVRGQRWGPAPDRITLLHEPGRDLDSWGDLPAHLAQELGFGVVSFDLPGHGLSDDPWEPSRLGTVVGELVKRANLPFRQVLVTAGVTARAALDAVPDLGRVAVVCLSPHSPPNVGDPLRSPEAPKLFFAGSMAGEDLQHARMLATACGGWANVTSIPVDERGTRLLASTRSHQIEEAIVSFTRDFLALRAPLASRSSAAELNLDVIDSQLNSSR